MKLVILGAGASYDSILYPFDDVKDRIKWRPPLANELFGLRPNFRNHYFSVKGAKALFSELNTVSDIEDYLQQKWDFVETHRANELLASLIGAQYYLQRIMQQVSDEYWLVGVNNYDILVRKALDYAVAKKEEVCFVTFNYDLLLEYSLRKSYSGKNDFLQIDEYIKYPLKIIKPHGSCNWFKRFKFNHPVKYGTQSIEDYLFDSRPSLYDIQANLEPTIIAGLENARRDDTNGHNYHLFPQILIPLKNKDEFVLPESHLQVLEKSISQTSDILVIGWKGQEQAFLKLLSEKLSNKEIGVTIVDPNPDQTINNLKDSLGKATFQKFNQRVGKLKSYQREDSWEVENRQFYFEGGFSAYITQIQDRKFPDFFSYE